jgi:hypothetical protein
MRRMFFASSLRPRSAWPSVRKAPMGDKAGATPALIVDV